MRYSIDTSALLDGWNRYYPPDVFPALWQRLGKLIADGDLRASEEVLDELTRKDDLVLAWAREKPDFFMASSEHVQLVVIEILGAHEKLIDTRSGRSGADPFVIAAAEVSGSIVVTGERPTNRLERPNIPDVCRARGVEWVSLLQLIRQQHWTF